MLLSDEPSLILITLKLLQVVIYQQINPGRDDLYCKDFTFPLKNLCPQSVTEGLLEFANLSLCFHG